MKQISGRRLGTRDTRTGADEPYGVASFRPIAVAEVELQDGLKSLLDAPARNAIDGDKGPRPGLILVRLHSHPLGLANLDLASRNPKADWVPIVSALVGEALAGHMRDDALGEPFDYWNGHSATLPNCLEDRRHVLEAARLVSVIVATRERPAKLMRCLDSLRCLEYSAYEVLVVDNCPETDRTERVVRAYSDGPVDIKYLCEDERGLGAAHNRGLVDARGDIVAFTDDDVEVDRHWLSEIVAPFVRDQRVGGASGLILPAELETPAQVMLESHGRFSKGFVPRDVDLEQHRPGDLLFPFTIGRFGSGANMAFETEVLRSIGGFDPALGTGTSARGGDDLAAMFRLLTSGRMFAYRPGAIVWHYHHREFAAVTRQAEGYGVGLGAYIASVGIDKPRVAASMISRLPAAASYAYRQARATSVGRGDVAMALGNGIPQWPNAMGRRQIWGLIKGPAAYSKSRVLHWQYQLRTR